MRDLTTSFRLLTRMMKLYPTDLSIKFLGYLEILNQTREMILSARKWSRTYFTKSSLHALPPRIRQLKLDRAVRCTRATRPIAHSVMLAPAIE